MYDAVALFEALKTRPIRGVTCRGKTDGGGAQVQAIFSARVFAHAANVPYFHTPLRRVAHAPGFRWKWAAAWEEAFGLQYGHPRAKGAGKIVKTRRFLKRYRGPPPIIGDAYFHSFCDADPDRYLPLLDQFRANCKLLKQTTRDTPVAAIHIRRGDVAIPGAEIAYRMTSMDDNARAIETIRSNWPGIDVQVYSQGKPEDFAGLPGGCTLHLDTDVFETMAALMNADVLVTAKSSFSYVAALLSQGTIIFEPFWHKPMSSWTIRSPDGSFEMKPPVD
jgi:hypothetical protein